MKQIKEVARCGSSKPGHLVGRTTRICEICKTKRCARPTCKKWKPWSEFPKATHKPDLEPYERGMSCHCKECQ